jgi:hypothetical protein
MGLIRGAFGAAAVAILAQAAAAPVSALSAHDITLYATAFDAAERGDTAAADAAVAQVSDRCLAGKVQYLELTRGKARTASYAELSNWLKSFADMPGASQVYELALKRKPADAPPLTPVSTLVGAPDGSLRLATARRTQPGKPTSAASRNWRCGSRAPAATPGSPASPPTDSAATPTRWPRSRAWRPTRPRTGRPAPLAASGRRAPRPRPACPTAPRRC